MFCTWRSKLAPSLALYDRNLKLVVKVIVCLSSKALKKSWKKAEKEYFENPGFLSCGSLQTLAQRICASIVVQACWGSVFLSLKNAFIDRRRSRFIMHLRNMTIFFITYKSLVIYCNFHFQLKTIDDRSKFVLQTQKCCPISQKCFYENLRMY